MIDIHCHILPDFDDGAKNREITVEMLQEASSQGVSTIVATPHYSENCTEKYCKQFAVAEALADSFNIKLLRGFEFDMSYLLKHKHDDVLFKLLDCNYILIDFVNNYISEQYFDVIENLLLQYRVIIAHPERLFSIKEIDFLKQLVDMGCYLQINTKSILGSHKPTFKFADKLLKLGIVHLIASDAHDNKHRKINHKYAYERFSKLYGKASADKIFIENVEALLNGKECSMIKVKKSFLAYLGIKR